MIPSRLRRLKTILWALVGVLAVLTVARFANGLGVTTGLNDTTPWGFWIAFDVMAGVALAAGGFVLAGSVYIFGLEKYRPFVRPAILTAFLGYAAVAMGLLYDLGLPWHIWHPLRYPQPQSVLFEVAMCVMLYLTVLFLEFSPVILEHPRFDKPFFRKVHAFLKKAVIPLVIAGIVLSTLHQSSLGSLFLITPYRLHALWYSPIIWVLFFVSAIGLGLMMVTLESFFSAWAFGHKLRMDRLAGLGRAAAIVLFVYLGLRLLDLGLRGDLAMAFDGSTHGLLFLAEIVVAALLPAVLLSIPRVRKSPRGLLAASILTVAGVMGYRFNVCIVAFLRPEGMGYTPAWTEILISVGIVAGAMLVFIALVERLKVYPADDEDGAAPAARPADAFDPRRLGSMLPERLAMPRRYSLAVVLGASLCLALLPSEALFGAQPSKTPVHANRELEGGIAIDANRDGRFVLFPHDAHVKDLGGDASCALCHHQNLPFQKQSACTACHQDMFLVTDTFDHGRHVSHLGGNDGCVRCHEDAALPKTRRTAASCASCHDAMVAEGSRIETDGLVGRAVGYRDAMHGLCIGCHEEKAREDPAAYPATFAECGRCHQGEVLDVTTRGPYVRKGDAR